MIIELIYRVFDVFLSFIKESSLFYFESSIKLSIFIFYIDDFFEEFIEFGE